MRLGLPRSLGLGVCCWRSNWRRRVLLLGAAAAPGLWSRSKPCWINTLAMLLTVRLSPSAAAAKRSSSSSGNTTWMRGDFGLPLLEV